MDINVYENETINWEISDKDQVIQNVKNLFNIGMFSIPLNRQIGVSKEYLDKHKEEAELLLLSELERNIKIYEPRAKLLSFSLMENKPGEYKVELQITGGN